MTPNAWIAVAIAGLTAGFAPLFLAPLLRKWGVVDVPNERSSHAVPTLRGGGLATLLGLTVGLITAILFIDSASDRQFLALIGVAGFLMGVLGFIEDVRGVPIRWRASAQLFVGAGMSYVAVELSGVSPWWIPLLAFMFIAFVNAANFMDGINGISGLHGFVVGLAFAAVGTVTETSWLVVAGSMVAVVCVAFLPWNLRRQGMFLGDVGSYLIGGTVITVTVLAVLDGVPLLAGVAPVIIYFADTGATLVRRILAGERWYAPHRSHVYEQLTDFGLSHLFVASLVAGLTMLCSFAGALPLFSDFSQIISVLALVVLVVIYLQLPSVFRSYRMRRQ